MEVPEELPILAIKNTVLFPGVIFPITVGRDKSIRLIKEANKGDKTIAVVSQKILKSKIQGSKMCIQLGYWLKLLS